MVHKIFLIGIMCGLIGTYAMELHSEGGGDGGSSEGNGGDQNGGYADPPPRQPWRRPPSGPGVLTPPPEHPVVKQGPAGNMSFADQEYYMEKLVLGDFKFLNKNKQNAVSFVYSLSLDGIDALYTVMEQKINDSDALEALKDVVQRAYDRSMQYDGDAGIAYRDALQDLIKGITIRSSGRALSAVLSRVQKSAALDHITQLQSQLASLEAIKNPQAATLEEIQQAYTLFNEIKTLVSNLKTIQRLKTGELDTLMKQLSVAGFTGSVSSRFTYTEKVQETLANIKNPAKNLTVQQSLYGLLGFSDEEVETLTDTQVADRIEALKQFFPAQATFFETLRSIVGNEVGRAVYQYYRVAYPDSELGLLPSYQGIDFTSITRATGDINYQKLEQNFGPKGNFAAVIINYNKLQLATQALSALVSRSALSQIKEFFGAIVDFVKSMFVAQATVSALNQQINQIRFLMTELVVKNKDGTVSLTVAQEMSTNFKNTLSQNLGRMHESLTELLTLNMVKGADVADIITTIESIRKLLQPGVS